MSLLFKNSSFKSKNMLDLPKGSFNPKSQTWLFQNEKIVNHKDFSIYMGTGSPTTYSATTGVGKDQDTDDRGT